MPPLLHPFLRWVNRLPLWRSGRVPVWGFRLRAPTFDRWLCLVLHACRRMGAADRAFLTAQVRPGMAVVDIGANQGLYTLLLAGLAGPGGSVDAFEPDAMLHAALVDNLAANPVAATVRAHPVAAGAEPADLILHRSLLNSGDNRLAAASSQSGPREPVAIRVERLDGMLAGRRVEFVKMDVQGWELEALRGMQGLLDDPRNRALAIYFEYWPHGLREAGSEGLDLLRFLAANGFRLHQPSGDRSGNPIGDLPTFAAAIQGNRYLNLFAVRD